MPTRKNFLNRARERRKKALKSLEKRLKDPNYLLKRFKNFDGNPLHWVEKKHYKKTQKELQKLKENIEEKLV